MAMGGYPIWTTAVCAACASPQASDRVPGGVVIQEPAAKVCQLTGDIDRQTGRPTANLTTHRWKLEGTDLGVAFRHKDRTILLFGDTFGPRGGDAYAWTKDRSARDGLDLTFYNSGGIYKPVLIPGIRQEGFEVPMAGVSVGSRMYVYHTTDHSPAKTMGRSVVAASDDDGETFRLLYTLSSQHFINVSVALVNARDWPGLPVSRGKALLLFGSGDYRRSDVRLACQPADAAGSRDSVRFYAGLGSDGSPRWSSDEDDARALFAHPTVGELSVAWNRYLRRWLMTYNGAPPRGIHLRSSVKPWGPWSETQLLFSPRDGYGKFMHVAGADDKLADPGRENEWGGEYGPYQLPDYATGTNGKTTVYLTMSTWNPYQVILMRARLALASVKP